MTDYTHTNLLSFNNQLAAMLGDPLKSFFIEAELTNYCREALLTWGSASLYYRDRGFFNTATSFPFYDLAAELDNLVMTTRDRELAQQLMYSLIEPQIVDWLLWPGTEQFSLAAIQDSIQRICNQFLLETGMVLSTVEILNLPTPASRVTIPESVMDVRRVTSFDVDNRYRILSKEDEAVLQAYSTDWNISPKSRPDFWTIVTQPLLTLQLAPPANDLVMLQLLAIPHGNTLDFEVGQILGIPEAFIWVIKYGVLMDLLGGSSTQAADSPRAKYAEMRFHEGIELAKLYPSVLTAEVNGRQINVTSLYDQDHYKWNWQNTTGTPKTLLTAGWNLIALSPVPDAADVAITVDYVRNPLLPTIGTDFIQIEKGYISMLLDYARHLALFKVGGEEFLKSRQGYDRMVQTAALYNGRLKAQSRLFSSLYTNIPAEKNKRPFSEELDSGDEEAAA